MCGEPECCLRVGHRDEVLSSASCWWPVRHERTRQSNRKEAASLDDGAGRYVSRARPKAPSGRACPRHDLAPVGGWPLLVWTGPTSTRYSRSSGTLSETRTRSRANGWASHREINTFSESADRREISGSDARHARLPGSPSGRAMSLREARDFMFDLAKKWLDSLERRQQDR